MGFWIWSEVNSCTGLISVLECVIRLEGKREAKSGYYNVSTWMLSQNEEI